MYVALTRSATSTQQWRSISKRRLSMTPDGIMCSRLVSHDRMRLESRNWHAGAWHKTLWVYGLVQRITRSLRKHMTLHH